MWDTVAMVTNSNPTSTLRTSSLFSYSRAAKPCHCWHCGIFYGKAEQTKVAEHKRSIPVSSADAFVFQRKGVRVSYHIQAGGQSFVHHTNAICLFPNITKQHKRELIHFNRRRHYRIWKISRMKTKQGFLPLTRLDTLQANKQREREKQSSDQHGVCRLARKTAEINEQLPHSVWSAI